MAASLSRSRSVRMWLISRSRASLARSYVSMPSSLVESRPSCSSCCTLLRTCERMASSASRDFLRNAFLISGRRNLGGWAGAVNGGEDHTTQVIDSGLGHSNAHDVAGRGDAPHADRPVDLRGLAGRAPDERAVGRLLFHQHADLGAELSAGEPGGDARLRLHHPLPPGALRALWQVPGQGRGVRVLLLRVFENADALELALLEEVAEDAHVVVGLAGEAH